MDASECSWCDTEIEEGGIPFKGLMFCSVACKDDWNDDNVDVESLDLGEFEERDPTTDELDEFEGELPPDEENDF